MTDYDHQARYHQWVQENQQRQCPVCYGRGWVLQEDATGKPTQEMPCPYCHGQRHEGWAPQRRAAKFDQWDKRRKWLIICTIVFVALLALSITNPVAGMLGWIVIVGWPLYWIHRRPKEEKPGYTPRHAPGFTDNRERNALGLFAGALAARRLLGDLFKDLKR